MTNIWILVKNIKNPNKSPNLSNKTLEPPCKHPSKSLLDLTLSYVAMETERRCYGGGAPVAETFNFMVQTVLVAEKSVCWLLFLIGSIPNNVDALTNLLEAEKRFPLSELNYVTSPADECKDDSETEDDSDDEDAVVGDDSDNNAEDSSGDDNDDKEGDPNSDSDANEDAGSDEDDDDDDEDDDDDDDEDDEDDDDDEEEENQPPFKKKK